MFKTFWKDWSDLCIKPQLEFIKRHKILYGVILSITFICSILMAVSFMQIGKSTQKTSDLIGSLANQEFDKLFKEEGRRPLSF